MVPTVLNYASKWSILFMDLRRTVDIRWRLSGWLQFTTFNTFNITLFLEILNHGYKLFFLYSTEVLIDLNHQVVFTLTMIIHIVQNNN